MITLEDLEINKLVPVDADGAFNDSVRMDLILETHGKFFEGDIVVAFNHSSKSGFHSVTDLEVVYVENEKQQLLDEEKVDTEKLSAHIEELLYNERVFSDGETMMEYE